MKRRPKKNMQVFITRHGSIQLAMVLQIFRKPKRNQFSDGRGLFWGTLAIGNPPPRKSDGSSMFHWSSLQDWRYEIYPATPEGYQQAQQHLLRTYYNKVLNKIQWELDEVQHHLKGHRKIIKEFEGTTYENWVMKNMI